MQHQDQPSGDPVPSTDPVVPVSTPAVQPLQLGAQPVAFVQLHQVVRQAQMPACYQEVPPARPQQLSWNGPLGNYMAVNVGVNLPALAPYTQHVPDTAHHLVPAMLKQPHQLQASHMQSQQPLQQQWSAGSPGPQMQQQLAAQHAQMPTNQPSYSIMHKTELRCEQLPFWQPAQPGAGESGARTAAAVRPVPYAQLQQAQAGAALTQQAASLVAASGMPGQLQTQLLALAPQQQLQPVQLQEIPAYALVLLPPAGSEPEQLLHAQADGLSSTALQQHGQQQKQHRKTRRGPNRGRSKQKKAQQQEAAAAGGVTEVARAAASSQRPGNMMQPGPEHLIGQARSARITSGSSMSYSSAATAGSSGSGLPSSPNGTDTVAEEQGAAGCPQKKCTRRRGRRGKKGSSQDAPAADASQCEQREGQALTEPITAAAAAGSTGGSKTSGSQQRVPASPLPPLAAAGVAASHSPVQPVKRTTGLSHRQRYRRKQWELHRAMEQQRVQAEADAKQQAEVHVLQATAQAQLATPQQLPLVWRGLQGCASAQQLQGSQVVPKAAPVPAELQQHVDLLAAAAASSNRASAAGTSTGATAVSCGTSPSGAGAFASWSTSSPHETQGGDGPGHVDQKLDEWLSKLLEL